MQRKSQTHRSVHIVARHLAYQGCLACQGPSKSLSPRISVCESVECHCYRPIIHSVVNNAVTYCIHPFRYAITELYVTTKTPSYVDFFHDRAICLFRRWFGHIPAVSVACLKDMGFFCVFVIARLLLFCGRYD